MPYTIDAVIDASRITELIRAMERSAFTYRESPSAAARAAAYVQGKDALRNLAQCRRKPPQDSDDVTAPVTHSVA